MKKIVLYTLCLCILIGVCSAGVFAEQLDPEPEHWGFSLIADDVTPTGMTLIMNWPGVSEDIHLYFGRAYCLEVLVEDTWESVPYVNGPPRFTAEALGLYPRTIARFSIDWENGYGQLQPGHYRVVKSFLAYKDNDRQDEAVFYADFVITDPHTCQSEDQDQLCDVCLALIGHECRNQNLDLQCDWCGRRIDQFCVVGNAEWMGNWDPTSELGIMEAYRPNVYKKVFYDVPPGNYELKIIKHGSFDQSWGGEDGNFCFTLPIQHDVTVYFTIHGDIGVVDLDGLPVVPLDEDVYRVVGNADWLGGWDPANPTGVMTKLEDGTYRKEYRDVPPGTYELKITKNGTWEESWGDRDNNFCFTVEHKLDLTVDFTLKDGEGVILVYGNGLCILEEEEEEGEKSADTSDLPVGLVATVLLLCVAAIPWLHSKKERYHT